MGPYRGYAHTTGRGWEHSAGAHGLERAAKDGWRVNKLVRHDGTNNKRARRGCYPGVDGERTTGVVHDYGGAILTRSLFERVRARDCCIKCAAPTRSSGCARFARRRTALHPAVLHCLGQCTDHACRDVEIPG